MTIGGLLLRGTVGGGMKGLVVVCESVEYFSCHFKGCLGISDIKNGGLFHDLICII